MTFSIPAPLEALIRAKVSSGFYDSAAQVVEEALLLLEERDHLRELRRQRLVDQLASGVFQADNRQLVGSDEVFAGLSSHGDRAPE